MLTLKDVSIGYKNATAHNINFSVGRGECILLCGANGTGKTTLLRTLSGLIPPLKGEITNINWEIAMIPSRIPRVSGFTLFDFVRVGCWKESSCFGRIDQGMKKAIEAVLEELRIAELSGKDIVELSDGEFQKACIAVSLVKKSDIILLDEPTAFLDADSRIMVLNLVKELTSKTDISIVFSSHDIKDSIEVATRILGIDRLGYVHDTVNEDRTALLSTCFNYSF